MTRQTIAGLTVESLIANGIDHIYCVPGVQNDEFFDALFDRREALRPIHARHEQGAAYMALGAALATGRPQAFVVVPGPGFLNACAALCTAQALNAPVLALVGQIPTTAIGRNLGVLHEIKGQFETLSSLTKHAVRVTRGADAAGQFAAAWQALKGGRPQPVGIEVPVDCWLKPCVFDPADLAIVAPAPLAADADALGKAATAMANAECPVIFVGGGAQGHSRAIRALAEKIDAPVAAFRTGHGVMPADHPLAINMPVAHALWAECDLVIGLGTRLTTPLHEWGTDDRLKVVHVDVDDTVLGQHAGPTKTPVHADLATALPALTSLVPCVTRQEWRQRVNSERTRLAGKVAQELAPQLAWLSTIRAALPANGILVDEVTQLGFVARFAFPAQQPRTFLSTGYQGTLGYGIATALGAADARRDVPVVSISGDGGALFTIAELATAVHHDIPLTIIVFNDNAYGNVRLLQRERYQGRYIASDLSNPDFVALARSFGVAASRARTTDELSEQLARAIASPGAHLIEVPVGTFPSPWDFIVMEPVRGKGGA